MAKVKKCTKGFERLALESYVAEHPGDGTAQQGLIDFLLEIGYKPMGARRAVACLVREATERWIAAKVEATIRGNLNLAKIVRSCISDRLRGTRGRIEELIIVPGSVFPSWELMKGYYADDEGFRFDTVPPGRELDNRIRYVPVLVRVTVGARWVLSVWPGLCPDITATRPTGALAR